jgi:hypothetical protein
MHKENEAMSQDNQSFSNEGSKASRRAILTAAPVVAAAALAGGAVANAVAVSMVKAGEGDPIFAVIDQYRAAVRWRMVTMWKTWDFASEDDHPEFADRYDPYWEEQEKIYDAAFAGEWAAFDAVFETIPTSVAGVAAVLEVLGTNPYDGSTKADSVLVMAQGRYSSSYGYKPDDERANRYMTALAAELRNIVERGQA